MILQGARRADQTKLQQGNSAATMLAMNSTVLLPFFVIGGGLAVTVAWIIWWQRRLSDIGEWPECQGTIQSAEIEIVGSGRSATTLPVCAFSYTVDSEYYSGRFCLYPWKDSNDFPLRTLVDRKISVRFNPQKPADWFVPLDELDGFSVGQKKQGFGGPYPSD